MRHFHQNAKLHRQVAAIIIMKPLHYNRQLKSILLIIKYNWHRDLTTSITLNPLHNANQAILTRSLFTQKASTFCHMSTVPRSRSCATELTTQLCTSHRSHISLPGEAAVLDKGSWLDYKQLLWLWTDASFIIAQSQVDMSSLFIYITYSYTLF